MNEKVARETGRIHEKEQKDRSRQRAKESQVSAALNESESEFQCEPKDATLTFGSLEFHHKCCDAWSKQLSQFQQPWRIPFGSLDFQHKQLSPAFGFHNFNSLSHPSALSQAFH